MRRSARDDSARRICNRDRRGFIPVGKTLRRRSRAPTWSRRRTDSDARDLPQDVRRACGRLVEIPAGFSLLAPAHLGPVFRSSLFSPLGKLRIAIEPFIAARTSDDDESLDSFVTRRLGREVLDRVAQALAGGIYTADPKRLSMDGDDAALCRDGTASRQRHQGNARGGDARRESAHSEIRRHKRRAMEPVPELQKWNGDAARDARGTAGRIDSQGRRSSLERCRARRSASAWRLATRDGDSIDADAVICALPAYARRRCSWRHRAGGCEDRSTRSATRRRRRSIWLSRKRFRRAAARVRLRGAGNRASTNNRGQLFQLQVRRTRAGRRNPGARVRRWRDEPRDDGARRRRDGRRGARRVPRAAWSQRRAGIRRSQAMARLDAAVRSGAPGASRGNRARRRRNSGVRDRGRGVSRRRNSRLRARRRRGGDAIFAKLRQARNGASMPLRPQQYLDESRRRALGRA